MNKKLDVFLEKNNNHIASASALMKAAESAGVIGDAYLKIANSVIDTPYFQMNHVPDKYQGMVESAYLYWLFLADLNHALWDDGDVSFVSATMAGEVRFAMLFLKSEFDIIEQLKNTNFILNKQIASEVYGINAHKKILRKIGRKADSEPDLSFEDYQVLVHTDIHRFLADIDLFAKRSLL